MNYFTAILTLIILMSASYGFGFATLKWGVRDDTNYFPWLTAIGIAYLIVLGGVLNLAGVAYPLALFTALLLGMLFFILSFLPRFKLQPRTNISSLKINSSGHLLPIFLVATAVVFTATTLLPSDAFNRQDDFYTYLIRPVRMLQTGTLAGNPYELLGLDSLGAQAFLQGFILTNLPIEYLPGFDAVFCFGLAGFLLLAIARKFNLNWIYTTSAILAFLLINPQSVNVSALYSGVFVILGLLLASCLLTEKLNESRIAKPMGMAILTGLFIASIFALKTTLALFAGIYSLLFCLGLFVVTKNKLRALLLIAGAGFSAFIAVLPWLLLHLPNYLASLSGPSHPVVTTGNWFSPAKGSVRELLSAHELFYGGSLLGYITIIVILLILGILSVLFLLRSKENCSHQPGYSLISACACAAAIATYFLNDYLFDPEAALRYTCPLLISTLPFALLTSSYNATTSPALGQSGTLAKAFLKMSVFTALTLVLFFFGKSFLERIDRAYNMHATLSYPINSEDIRYTSHAVSDEARQLIRSIQYQTEPGAKIFAWIPTPMHLDFARNEIPTLMSSSLINPWLDIPLKGNSNDLLQHLRKQGVRYILWQYQVDNTNARERYVQMRRSPFLIYRQLAERNLYMRDMMDTMMMGGTFLYHQNGIVLFDLNQIN